MTGLKNIQLTIATPNEPLDNFKIELDGRLHYRSEFRSRNFLLKNWTSAVTHKVLSYRTKNSHWEKLSSDDAFYSPVRSASLRIESKDRQGPIARSMKCPRPVRQKAIMLSTGNERTGAEFSLRKSEARTSAAPIMSTRPRPARRSRLWTQKEVHEWPR